MPAAPTGDVHQTTQDTPRTRPPLLPRESSPWLAIIPLLATALFYTLPSDAQASRVVQFLPQVLGYLALFAWASRNKSVLLRLGLSWTIFRSSIATGSIVGQILGLLNTVVILWLVPYLGGDIGFLRETPHAQIPVLAMVPWFILGIAVFVEVNFRGFQLGRLISLATSTEPHQADEPSTSRFPPLGVACAIALSAVAFAFDPFLVATFRHLHWIAIWDGVVWGWFLWRRRDLALTIVAHAVEVIVLYLVVRTALGA